jgi:hypothetical protein
MSSILHRQGLNSRLCIRVLYIIFPLSQESFSVGPKSQKKTLLETFLKVITGFLDFSSSYSEMTNYHIICLNINFI